MFFVDVVRQHTEHPLGRFGHRKTEHYSIHPTCIENKSQYMGTSALTANVHLESISWGVVESFSQSFLLIAIASTLSFTMLTDKGVAVSFCASPHTVFTISLASCNIQNLCNSVCFHSVAG